MYIQKQNFLNVDYQRGRGLKLNWNFKDILGREKYFRHLIVLANCEREYAWSFLESFYKKMKYGDLLSCIYLRRDNEIKLCSWIEKTHINKFKPETYLKQFSISALDQTKKIEMIQKAGTESSQQNGHVVVSVLMQTGDSSKSYQEIVEQGRNLRNQFNYIVNLYGRNQENSISIHKGINKFKLTPQNINEHVQFYHNFINNAVIPFAKIKIECLNGQIGLFNESYWSNADFNSIEASYYGPSSQFSFDQLLFYIQDQSREIDIHLQITLTLKLFSDKQYETSKKIQLHYSYEKDGSMTLHDARYHAFKIFKNIYLTENPFECSSIVRLFHKMDNKSQSIQLL